MRVERELLCQSVSYIGGKVLLEKFSESGSRIALDYKGDRVLLMGKV